MHVLNPKSSFLRNRLYTVFIGLVLILAVTSCTQPKDVNLVDFVVREMAPGSERGVAYLSIENNSKENLILNYVQSPRIDNIEVHQHLYENGMMKMREVRHLSIDPGQRLSMGPGGYHLMLFGVDKPFKEGESIEFTFEFQNRPAQTVMASVKRL